MNRNNDEKKEEAYNLYTEDIVEKPTVKYRKLIKLIKVAFSGIIFGAFACVTFMLLFPVMARKMLPYEKEKRADIVITRDEYPTEQMTLPDGSPVPEEKPDEVVVPEPTQGRENVDYSKLINHISNSMVRVYGTHSIENGDYFTNEDCASGVIFAEVDSEYILLTRYDGINDAASITVEFDEYGSATGYYVKGDKEMGVAIVSVKQSEIPQYSASKLQVIELGNSYMMHQGDDVVVSGRVMGADFSSNRGVVTNSGVKESHTDSYVGMLHTNMMKLSNDHGFLFDSKGALIGIPANNESGESMVFYGISDMKALIESLSNGVSVTYCGIIGETVTGNLSNKYDLPIGVYVTNVEEGSPAFEAGIQAGDVITSVNDESILTFNAFSEKIYKLGSMQKATINVKRLGKEGYKDILFSVMLTNRD